MSVIRRELEKEIICFTPANLTVNGEPVFRPHQTPDELRQEVEAVAQDMLRKAFSK